METRFTHDAHRARMSRPAPVRAVTRTGATGRRRSAVARGAITAAAPVLGSLGPRASVGAVRTSCAPRRHLRTGFAPSQPPSQPLRALTMVYGPCNEARSSSHCSDPRTALTKHP